MPWSGEEQAGVANFSDWDANDNDEIAQQEFKTSDELFGNDDDDQLFGGDGSDDIQGEGGDDYLFGVGDDEADNVVGGAGNDTCVVDQNDSVSGCENVITR